MDNPAAPQAEAERYAYMLAVTNPLREPLVRAAIARLSLPAGSRGLDVGCGLGLQALLLAEAVGRAGRVAGLDCCEPFLDLARRRAREAGLAARLSFHHGDLAALPFPDGSFDWLWSADCAGYPAPDPDGLLRELVRVVRPGGLIALFFWSSQVLLPGYPWLEAQLNTTRSGLAPFAPEMAPRSHSLCALGWFRDAGLVDLGAETLAHAVSAPLTPEVRAGLLALLWMRWQGAEAELAPADWAEYRRLCAPESPDLIVDQPGYCAFWTCSLFYGRVAGASLKACVTARTGRG